jgi:hypothetical protein
MPQYFFHIRNGETSNPDDEGGFFDNFAAAQREATLSVRDLVSEAVTWGEPAMGFKIEIADGTGKIVGLVSSREVLH